MSCVDRVVISIVACEQAPGKDGEKICEPKNIKVKNLESEAISIGTLFKSYTNPNTRAILQVGAFIVASSHLTNLHEHVRKPCVYNRA